MAPRNSRSIRHTRITNVLLVAHSRNSTGHYISAPREQPTPCGTSRNRQSSPTTANKHVQRERGVPSVSAGAFFFASGMMGRGYQKAKFLIRRRRRRAELVTPTASAVLRRLRRRSLVSVGREGGGLSGEGLTSSGASWLSGVL